MSISERVADHPFWYHTLDLGGGVVTPGAWDLRSVVDRFPWPDVRGKRCLDVGPFDGFYAFELERRGAAEVIAADVAGQEDLDWPWQVRSGMLDPGWNDRYGEEGFDLGGGFRLAADALGSKAERIECSIYDLDPADLGTFDVVTCGSLLLHLRDPVRALEAVRGVCDGQFLSVESIDAWLTLLRPGRPAARLDGVGNRCVWWVANAAGHARMLVAAGFEITEAVRPVGFPFVGRQTGRRGITTRAVERLVAGNAGVLHHPILAAPRRPRR